MASRSVEQTQERETGVSLEWTVARSLEGVPTLMCAGVEAGCEPGLCSQQTSLVRDLGRQLWQSETRLDCVFDEVPGAASRVSWALSVREQGTDRSSFRFCMA